MLSANYHIRTKAQNGGITLVVEAYPLLGLHRLYYSMCSGNDKFSKSIGRTNAFNSDSLVLNTPITSVYHAIDVFFTKVDKDTARIAFNSLCYNFFGMSYTALQTHCGGFVDVSVDTHKLLKLAMEHAEHNHYQLSFYEITCLFKFAKYL